MLNVSSSGCADHAYLLTLHPLLGWITDYNAAWAAYWQYAQAHGQQMQEAQQQQGAGPRKPLWYK